MADTTRWRFYCPACGNPCALAPDDPDDDTVCTASCEKGHGWSVTIDPDNERSDDGSAIFGFQCDGTPASEMTS